MTLEVMRLYDPGNLRKVVLLGCYYARDFHSGGKPMAKFCTTLVLDADPNSRPNLPMVAAWDADVYIKSGGTKQTKHVTGGQYTSVNATTRNSFKVIAAIDGWGATANYKLKTYAEAVHDWHD